MKNLKKIGIGLITVLITASFISLNVNVKAAPPTIVVTNVTTNKLNGTYGINEEILISIIFSDLVYVTGTPQLTLETGEVDAVVSFRFASASADTLIFLYKVGAGQNSSDLDYTSTSALTGTIKNSTGGDVNLTLPTPGGANSLGANKNIVIDTSGGDGGGDGGGGPIPFGNFFIGFASLAVIALLLIVKKRKILVKR